MKRLTLDLDDKGVPMKRFTVDRIEGATAVLLDDDGEEHEVVAASLPSECRSEGAVLLVPESPGSAPDWSAAARDRAEEKRLLAEGAERLDRLRRRDPGGDVKL